MTKQATEPAALVAALAEKHPELQRRCPKNFNWGTCPGSGGYAVAGRCPECKTGVRPHPGTQKIRPHKTDLPAHGNDCHCHGLGYLPVSLLEAAAAALEKRVVVFLDYDGLDDIWCAATATNYYAEAPTWYEATVRAWARSAGLEA